MERFRLDIEICVVLLQAEEKTMKRSKMDQDEPHSPPLINPPDPVNELHSQVNLFDFHFQPVTSHERIFPEWPVHPSPLLTPRDFQRIEAIRIAFEKRIELGS